MLTIKIAMKIFSDSKKQKRNSVAATVSELGSAISSVKDARVAVERYMKQRAEKQLTNNGLLLPLRLLNEVEAKLKSYVKD